MKKKTRQGKKPSVALPAGLKVSRRPISRERMRQLVEDRGIASGGRNIVHGGSARGEWLRE
jgi:hypothetical protein